MMKRQLVALALVAALFCGSPSQAQTPTNGLVEASGSIGATLTAIKATPGRVYGWHFYNPNAAVAYIQFFNAVPGNVTLGTTPPAMSLGIAPNSPVYIEITLGLRFSTAITIAVTTTRAGAVGPAATVDYNIFAY